jgi:hypothetical protein
MMTLGQVLKCKQDMKKTMQGRKMKSLQKAREKAAHQPHKSILKHMLSLSEASL